MTRFALICFTMILTAAALAEDRWSLDLVPGPSAEATPGNTSGWGFQATNLSHDHWLHLSQVRADSTFQHGLLTAAVFLLSPKNVAPDSTISVPWTSLSGLASFTWDPDAPVGYVNSGNFTVQGKWFSGDPSDGGSLLGPATAMATPYEAHVLSTPEPATFCAFGIGSLCLWRRRSK